MVFAGETDDPETLEELSELGYSQPEQVLAIVRGWHHGRYPAVRSPRARERLTEVQPLLIEALADTVDPDAALASFDRFLSELPAGVQLFSLLKANPALMRLIADIMGSAPRLARILSRAAACSMPCSIPRRSASVPTRRDRPHPGQRIRRCTAHGRRRCHAGHSRPRARHRQRAGLPDRRARA